MLRFSLFIFTHDHVVIYWDTFYSWRIYSWRI